MRIARSVAELRAVLRRFKDDLNQGGSGGAFESSGVGFVPTMGALHEGHLSLVRAARSNHEIVVMSIFVNPRQFGDSTDFATYPRDEQRDLELAKANGVDIVFIPTPEEMYPAGFATTVRVDDRLTGVLEGSVRGREHFDGMATIVAKLLLAVQPAAAFFGEKDFQQLVVVRRLVRDLGIGTRIVGCPTLREADGLALSSRNVRLTAAERERAAAIPKALRAISAAVGSGQTEVRVLRKLGHDMLVSAGLAIEYLEFVHPESLEPVDRVTGATACAVAVSAESTRLIDNELLVPPANEGISRDS